jgi:hypothetical protein
LTIYLMHFIASSKSTPNFAKSSQARPNPGQENQRKRLGFPWILLAEMSLFKGLSRPPRAKNLSWLHSLPIGLAEPRFRSRAWPKVTRASSFHKQNAAANPAAAKEGLAFHDPRAIKAISSSGSSGRSRKHSTRGPRFGAARPNTSKHTFKQKCLDWIGDRLRRINRGTLLLAS